MYSGSYSGASYDHYFDRFEESPLERVKQQYWTAKQTIMSKLGKKEDDSLVASDAELDAKLAVFGSIKTTSETLLKCIENYQDYIGDLAHEENALGRFLKSRGKADKTEAGKLMAAVGRAQSYTAHQRLALRVPLVRLYQELDVFTRRAVFDCYSTIEAALKARNEYRGSLLRMKDVSQQLDPDTYKQLDKFRSVQALVRKNKAKFDKLKLACLQKIDVLAASRCNLFSQVLTSYHACLMRFWDKTAKAHHTISESFNGYQHYEFSVLKNLTEPSLQLATLAAGDDQTADKKENGSMGEELIALGNSGENLVRTESLEDLFKDSPTHQKKDSKDNSMSIFEPRMDDMANFRSQTGEGSLMNVDPLSCHSKETNSRELITPSAGGVGNAGGQFIDQLLADVNQEAPENSFSKQWQQAFGISTNFAAAAPSAGNSSPATQRQTSQKPMMPSQLLDLQQPWSMAAANLDTGHGASAAPTPPPPAVNDKGNMKAKETKSSQRSAWFNLFADIDPLQNPDALGKTQSDTDRGC